MSDADDPQVRPAGGPSLAWYSTRAPDLPPPRTHLRALRRRLAIDALGCLALSSLCFSQASRDVLFRADFDFYSRLPLGAPTLTALILNIVALAAVGFLAVHAIRRVRRPLWRRLAAVGAATTVFVALNFARLTYDTAGRWMDALGRPGLLALVVLALAASWFWPRRALWTIRRIALALSPLAVFTLVAALWMFFEIARPPLWRRADPPPHNAIAPSLRRVVWLVFEELDQGVAFEARPTGLALPELDRLRGESLYADAAHAPADTTAVSMAALITGRPIVSAVPLNPNELELTFADGKPARWSAQPNVFSRARALGYNTALIGWHLPYARVLAGSLGVVDWRPSLAYDQARGETIAEALRNQWATLAPPLHVRRLYAERLAAVGDLALRGAADGRYGLVLLHLPLPQLPGIYDRADGRLTVRNFTGAEAEYLDNLELVDRFVGELRRGLERARLDDRTWLVVSSARSRPGGERRVPFLVRAPEGNRPTHVDAPFSTLVTQDLVAAILRGSVADSAAVARWLVRAPSVR